MCNLDILLAPGVDIFCGMIVIHSLAPPRADTVVGPFCYEPSWVDMYEYFNFLYLLRRRAGSTR